MSHFYLLEPKDYVLIGIPNALIARGGDLGAAIDGTLARLLGWGLDAAAYPRPYRLRQAGRRLEACLGVGWRDSTDMILDAIFAEARRRGQA